MFERVAWVAGMNGYGIERDRRGAGVEGTPMEFFAGKYVPPGEVRIDGALGHSRWREKRGKRGKRRVMGQKVSLGYPY